MSLGALKYTLLRVVIEQIPRSITINTFNSLVLIYVVEMYGRTSMTKPGPQHLAHLQEALLGRHRVRLEPLLLEPLLLERLRLQKLGLIQQLALRNLE